MKAHRSGVDGSSGSTSSVRSTKVPIRRKFRIVAEARPLRSGITAPAARGADEHADHADRDARVLADALVQDVPRGQAEVGPHHQGDAHAEERERQHQQGHPPADLRGGEPSGQHGRQGRGGRDAGQPGCRQPGSMGTRVAQLSRPSPEASPSPIRTQNGVPEGAGPMEVA